MSLCFFFIFLHFFVEMSMIQTNSQKKSCYSDYKSYTRKSEIVEKLIARKLIIGLYVHHTPRIKCYLNKTNNPKDRPMYSIDQHEKEYIHEWKVEHTFSIGKTALNSRKKLLNYFFSVSKTLARALSITYRSWAVSLRYLFRIMLVGWDTLSLLARVAIVHEGIHVNSDNAHWESQSDTSNNLTLSLTGRLSSVSNLCIVWSEKCFGKFIAWI